jgi:hypothetical protein
MATGKKLYSVETSHQANNWFNFKASSPAEIPVKLQQIKKALRKIGVIIANEDDMDIFKEVPLHKNREVYIKAVCPFCADWVWEDLEDFKLKRCWVDCPKCGEDFLIFPMKELLEMGVGCGTCDQRVDCLSVPSE